MSETVRRVGPADAMPQEAVDAVRRVAVCLRGPRGDGEVSGYLSDYAARQMLAAAVPFLASRDGSVAVEDYQAVQREAHFALVLSAIVRAYDHPADGTAYSRLREAVDDARRLLHEPFPYFASPASTGDRAPDGQ